MVRAKNPESFEKNVRCNSRYFAFHMLGECPVYRICWGGKP